MYSILIDLYFFPKKLLLYLCLTFSPELQGLLMNQLTIKVSINLCFVVLFYKVQMY